MAGQHHPPAAAPHPPGILEPGTTILPGVQNGNQYVVQQLLVQGAVGTVYAATLHSPTGSYLVGTGRPPDDPFHSPPRPPVPPQPQPQPQHQHQPQHQQPHSQLSHQQHQARHPHYYPHQPHNPHRPHALTALTPSPPSRPHGPHPHPQHLHRPHPHPQHPQPQARARYPNQPPQAVHAALPHRPAHPHRSQAHPPNPRPHAQHHQAHPQHPHHRRPHHPQPHPSSQQAHPPPPHAPPPAPSPQFAIKFIPLLKDWGHLTRLFREVIILNRLSRHPHIIKIRDLVIAPAFLLTSSGDTAPAIGIVMDRATCSLQQALDARQAADEHQPEGEVRWMFQQLALSVGYCHMQGVCHRDVKPENLLLCAQREGVAGPLRVLKLADFGWAKSVDVGMHAGTPQAGTFQYRAPEVPIGEEGPYDAFQADVWSCGVVLFHMLFPRTFQITLQQAAGGLPVDSWERQLQHGFPQLQDRTVSPECVSLLSSMLQVEPATRATMQQVLAHPWYRQDLPSAALQLNAQVAQQQPLLFQEALQQWLTATIQFHTGIVVG